MSDNLKLDGLAAVVNVGTKDKPQIVTVDPSTDLGSVDAKTMKALKDANALVSADEPAPEQSELTQQARVTLSPSSTAEEVSNYIRFGNAGKPLNADEAVALAADDAATAKLVLEAENLAHDGKGRKSVVEPLQKIVEAA